MNEGVIV